MTFEKNGNEKIKINENNNYFELIKTKKKEGKFNLFSEEIKQKINFVVVVVVVVGGLFDTIHLTINDA